MPGLRLDEIVDTEVDFYEDPAVCSRYRAILQRVDKARIGFIHGHGPR